MRDNFRELTFSQKNRRNVLFGIEIELGWDVNGSSCDYEDVSRNICRYFSKYSDLDFICRGYNHSLSSRWKLVTDSTLEFSSNHRGIEFVSPPLLVEDGVSKNHPIGLYNLTKVLNKRRICINDSCGVHVHFDVSKVKKQFFIDLYLFTPAINDFLFLLVKKYRKNSECIRKLNLNYTLQTRTVVMEHGNRAVLGELAGGKQLSEKLPATLAYKYLKNNFPKPNENLGSRLSVYRHYNAVNLSPFGRGQQTVEFRHHHGTIDYDEMKNWVLLLYDILSSVEKRGVSGISYAFKRFNELQHNSNLTKKLMFFMNFFNVSKEVRKYYLTKLRGRVDD